MYVTWIPDFPYPVREAVDSRAEHSEISSNQSAMVRLYVLPERAREAQRKLLRAGGAYFPFNTSLRCVSVDINGLGIQNGPQPNGQSSQDFCLIELTCQYRQKRGTTLSYTYNGSFETEMVTMTPENTAMWWGEFDGSGNAVLPQTPQVIPARQQMSFPRHNYRITRNYSGVDALPAWYLTNHGTTNALAVIDEDTGMIFAPGTVLWISGGNTYTMTFDESQPVGQQEIPVWSFSVVQLFKAFGWSAFYNPAKDSWAPVYHGKEKKLLQIYPQKVW